MFSMKTCVLLFIAVLVINAQSFTDQDVEDCADQNNVDKSIVEKLKNHVDFPPNKNAQCFLRCVFLRMGLMTESGDIVVSKFKPLQNHAKVPIEKCKDLKGSDLCETAFKILKCLGL